MSNFQEALKLSKTPEAFSEILSTRLTAAELMAQFIAGFDTDEAICKKVHASKGLTLDCDLLGRNCTSCILEFFDELARSGVKEFSRRG